MDVFDTQHMWLDTYRIKCCFMGILALVNFKDPYEHTYVAVIE